MEKKGFIIITVIFLVFIFLSQLRSINQPLQDNDEGIYLTTFKLIDAGHTVYKETFLSQPPGFLLSIYPGFIAFGKTLQAARLTIGLWAFIGSLTIIWLSFELKFKWVGLLAIGLLYLSVFYSKQTITLQSDILVSTFSLISLTSFFRFMKLFRIKWFIISMFFLNMAFWTKFDLSLVPAFVLSFFILFRSKKISYENIFASLIIFAIISIVFFLLFIFPFGINHIISNVINLRLQSASHFQPSIFQLINYLSHDLALTFMILGSIVFALFKRGTIRYSLLLISIWVVTVFIQLLFFRPLFPHHLSILVVPITLFFTYIVCNTIKNHFKMLYCLLLVILILTTLNRINAMMQSPQSIMNNDQKKAIEIINKNTKINDIVISDEEILNGISGRLPPPKLSDVSYVRILTGSLTPQEFKKQIDIYKPKLIIAWNGRLKSIEGFNEIIKSYEIQSEFGKSKIIYIWTD